MVKERSQSFHRSLVSLNGLDKAGFREWLFQPSALFGSQDKWWGGGGIREAAHEGIDFFMYRTADGSVRYLDGSIRIPAIAAGTVETVVDDFLGRSIFISHGTPEGSTGTLFTVYGHTVPLLSTVPGMFVREGDIIGTIAASIRSTVRSHLHISVMQIPDSVRPEELGWDLINRGGNVTLIDPLEMIDLPYSVISSPQ